MAAHLYENLNPKSDYFSNKNSKKTKEEILEIEKRLKETSTVYVGNLSMYTTEESLYELFSRCGEIKTIIMGINKETGLPIGFCFVEFNTHEEAGYAVEYISLTKLDNRVIRVDWDEGFKEGRQFGKGPGGFQVRDAFRTTEDPDRPFVTEDLKNSWTFNKSRGDRNNFRGGRGEGNYNFNRGSGRGGYRGGGGDRGEQGFGRGGMGGRFGNRPPRKDNDRRDYERKRAETQDDSDNEGGDDKYKRK